MTREVVMKNEFEIRGDVTVIFLKRRDGTVLETVIDTSDLTRAREFHNGKIPKGWDIHHIDEKKENNSPENLECLPKYEHTRLYSPHNNQYTKGRKRAKSS